ncbi:MAG: hypothetical protein EOS85_11575 [Mesorhizobium sp.]|nr:MAG: hypothetical protein EOS85_11575 [Mesorhizobium sp.]
MNVHHAAERQEALPADWRQRHRAFWELRHARLRLALAENDLASAQAELLAGGDPAVALEVLEETFAGLEGGPS